MLLQEGELRRPRTQHGTSYGVLVTEGRALPDAEREEYFEQYRKRRAERRKPPVQHARQASVVTASLAQSKIGIVDGAFEIKGDDLLIKAKGMSQSARTTGDLTFQ
jgi:hypothetical protein